jgi:hypothetical protein
MNQIFTKVEKIATFWLFSIILSNEWAWLLLDVFATIMGRKLLKKWNCSFGGIDMS